MLVCWFTARAEKTDLCKHNKHTRGRDQLFLRYATWSRSWTGANGRTALTPRAQGRFDFQLVAFSSKVVATRLMGWKKNAEHNCEGCVASGFLERSDKGSFTTINRSVSRWESFFFGIGLASVTSLVGRLVEEAVGPSGRNKSYAYNESWGLLEASCTRGLNVPRVRVRRPFFNWARPTRLMTKCDNLPYFTTNFVTYWLHRSSTWG